VEVALPVADVVMLSDDVTVLVPVAVALAHRDEVGELLGAMLIKVREGKTETDSDAEG
jgi:hypothetical protein